MSTALNFEHALTLHQQGELESAKNIYQQILDLDPHHYNSMHLLGLIHHQLGDSKTAASLVSQAIGINATHVLMHSNLATIFETLQRWADALTCWSKVIELEPKNHLAFHNRANVFTKINKPYHAVLDYYHATVLMPNFTEAHYSLGNLRLFELKHLDMALESYKRAFSINPEQELLFGMYLQAKTNLCNWEGVLEEFSEFEKKLEEQKPITVPFVALHITDRSDLHLIAAKTYAQIKNSSVSHLTVSPEQQSLLKSIVINLVENIV
jgi:tetratricopeptide (TPR) repeat protein